MDETVVICGKTESGCIAKYGFVFGCESVAIFKRIPTTSSDVIEKFVSETVTHVPLHFDNHLHGHLAQRANCFELLSVNGILLLYGARGLLNGTSDTMQYKHGKEADIMIKGAADAMLRLKNCNRAK